MDNNFYTTQQDATAYAPGPIGLPGPSVQYYTNPDPYNQAYTEDVPISDLETTNTWRTLAGAQPLRSNGEILQEQFDRATAPLSTLAAENDIHGLPRLLLNAGDFVTPLAVEHAGETALRKSIQNSVEKSRVPLSNLIGLHPYKANNVIRDYMLSPENSWLDRQVFASKLPEFQSRVARSIRSLERDPNTQYVVLPNSSRTDATLGNISHTARDKMRAELDPNFEPGIPPVVFGDYRNSPVADRILAGAREKSKYLDGDFTGAVQDGYHRTVALSDMGLPVPTVNTRYVVQDGRDMVLYPPSDISPQGFSARAEDVQRMMGGQPAAPRTYLRTTDAFSPADYARYRRQLAGMPDERLVDALHRKTGNLYEKRGDFFGNSGLDFNLENAIDDELALRSNESIPLMDPVEWAAEHSRDPVTKWVAQTELSPRFEQEMQVKIAEGHNPYGPTARHQAYNKILREDLSTNGTPFLGAPLDDPDYLRLTPGQLPTGFGRLMGIVAP